MLKYCRKIVTVLQGGFKMKRLSMFFLIALCWHQARGDILNVPSFENPTIQSAINDANNGDTIIVSPGSYRENINFLGKAITLTSQNPNNPNIVAATIIDGNQPADPNKGSVVTFSSGEKNNSVLTGFTITGGTGSWLPIAWHLHQVYWNRCGGGAVCYNMSEPTISKNVFVNNIAGQGGGIYVYGDPVNPANPSNPSVHVRPIITNNTFTGNSAIVGHGFVPPDSNYPNGDHGDGGAIVGFQGCDAVITGNVIQDNFADSYGGGVHLRQWSKGLIQKNLIYENQSLLGGGIHITYNSSPTVIENTIKQNISTGFGGGGIYVYYYSEPSISNNVIIQNDAGGATGGGIGVYWDSKPTIEFNLIAKNNARAGGGIYTNSGPLNILYNTVADNSAITGAGICLELSTEINAVGNIIAANTGSAQIYGDDGNALTAAYNDVWSQDKNNYGGLLENLTGINGNISKDPKFVSADTNDYSISISSPCINAGDPNFIVPPNQKDINGDDRIMGQYIDIGADEAWPVWNITKQTKYIHIQDSINQSNNGDTIIVGRGRYYETIIFGTHRIILSSADPNDWGVVEQTIIDANHSGTAITISGGQDANTIFTGFTITGGNAQNGHAGGIWCYAGPRIERNIIRNNYASYKGGGMYFWSADAQPLVTDNKIIENEATYGGGVFCDSSSRATLTGNYISNNAAATTGGGICCGLSSGKTIIMNNQIISNSSPLGGGMASEQAKNAVKIEGNLFSGNRADTKGGALWLAYGYPDIVNNTFSANRSPAGAAICLISGSSPNIVNNIVAFNETGFGIYATSPSSDPNFICNDFYANQPANYGPPLSDQTGLNGNISADPNFIANGYWDDANTPGNPNDDFFVMGNFHIHIDSPCVDAGDANLVPAELLTDFDNETRLYNNQVDIGADEMIPNRFDLNYDGIVDFYELRILAEEWLHSGSELRSDFHEDNFIDFYDFAELANQWLWTDSRRQ
jgi:hypothetical protein